VFSCTHLHQAAIKSLVQFELALLFYGETRYSKIALSNEGGLNHAIFISELR